MKDYIVILLLVLCGCASQSTIDSSTSIIDPQNAKPSFKTISSKAQPLVVTKPQTMRIKWLPIQPFGDGPEYVLLSSTNLIDWSTLIVTTTNNILVPRKPFEFFRLYSTNTITGESFWL